MGTYEWLEHVDGHLSAEGVSLIYRQRLLDELRDHIEDLYGDERNHAMSAETVSSEYLEQRLGQPQNVAQAVKSQGIGTTFAKRHPIFTYLVLPIPVLVVLWVAYVVGLAGILSTFQTYKDATWAEPVVTALTQGLAYVPAVVLTLFVAWVAVRSETRVAWWLAASVLIAFVSALMLVTCRMPTSPGTGTLQVGLGFPPELARWPQFFVPMLVAFALMAWTMKKRQKATLADAT